MKGRWRGGVAHHRFCQQVVIRVSVVGSEERVSQQVVASHPWNNRNRERHTKGEKTGEENRVGGAVLFGPEHPST